jgi:uridine kinase
MTQPLERTTFDELVEAARTAPPRAGDVRVVAIDGRSGAGKSTLARRLGRDLAAPVVQVEPLYEGWNGLETGIDLLVSHVLAPLAAGRTAEIPRYDWSEERWAHGYSLAPPPLLVVEGVGAGARRVAPYLSLLVWLQLAEETRKHRALERDGDGFRPHWERWSAQEQAMLEREQTPDRADIVLDTSRAGPSLGARGRHIVASVPVVRG